MRIKAWIGGKIVLKVCILFRRLWLNSEEDEYKKESYKERIKEEEDRGEGEEEFITCCWLIMFA